MREKTLGRLHKENTLNYIFRKDRLDVDIRLLQSNIVRSVRLFVWFVYFLTYKNSKYKNNDISCKNMMLYC